MPNDTTYEGLSERARIWIVGVGALIATLNLAAAWWFALTTAQSFALTKDAFTPFLVWFKESSAITLSPESRYDLAARAMHIVALGKLVANKQGIVLACFGSAFALAAIGFSLFIIGADGAFKVIAKSSAKAVPVLKSHVNAVVADTAKWEQQAAYFIDTHPRVVAFVKNAGLGLGVPYTHDGQRHDYVPDFLVRRDDGLNLILETKGFDRLAETKQQAARRWVAAVNAHGGYGQWAYRMVRDPNAVSDAVTTAVSG